MDFLRQNEDGLFQKTYPSKEKWPNLEAHANLLFAIKAGIPGSESVLIEALNKYGSVEGANFLLNAGNPTLKAAATSWAKSHGYAVKEGGVGNAKWGQK